MLVVLDKASNRALVVWRQEKALQGLAAPGLVVGLQHESAVDIWQCLARAVLVSAEEGLNQVARSHTPCFSDMYIHTHIICMPHHSGISVGLRYFFGGGLFSDVSSHLLKTGCF